MSSMSKERAFAALVVAFALALSVSCLAAVSQASGPYAAPADKRQAISHVLELYAQGWYEGNPSVLQQALHPDYVWRSVSVVKGKPSEVLARSGLGALDAADRGLGRMIPPSQRKAAITILSLDKDVASVRLVMSDRVELLHVVLWNNAWRVIDALAETGDFK